MENTYLNEINSPDESALNIKKEVAYYMFFWPWFLFFISFSISIAWYYLRSTDRIYQSKAQIQIKDSSESSSFLMDNFNPFGQQAVNIENHISIIKSYQILSKVVNKLDLQTRVYSVGLIKTPLLFKKNLPFQVQIDKLSPNKQWEMVVENNQVSISSDSLNYIFSSGQVLNEEYIKIKPQQPLFSKEITYLINKVPLNQAINELQNNLTILPASSSWGAEVINLTINGSNPTLNDVILNTLIEIISEDQVFDKREISEISIAFIDQRLQGLAKSIDTISKQTISYKIDNAIYDPQVQTGNALSNIIKVQEESFNLRIQLDIANGLRDQLQAQNQYEILPSNVGIDNLDINDLVNNYNIIVVERNNLLISTTEKNPLVIKFSNQLQKSRASILTGLNRYIDRLKFSLTSFEQVENRTRGLVADLPSKENALLDYARNFKIFEELYIFMLRRKEDASISYISALPDLKILSYGVSSNMSIYPNKKLTYTSALLVGFLLPFGILFFMKLLDTKINTRDDLENGLVDTPILGEIPLDDDIINNDKNNRSLIAESTRVVRSNLSFLINKNTSNVITVTSTVKGEGKSFIAYNIAASYAALGKKVLLIGADLRNPQIHNRIGVERTNLGLTTFLSDESYKDVDSLITKASSPNEMDILLSGSIPPNPSELLMRPRMSELLNILKERYDFLIIDSAPLLLVSDSSSLITISDLVVYVTRAQFSDKNIFPFIKELQKRPNMPKFGMVLNGLIVGNSKFGYNYKYAYSYRYRYSYAYKYNYGYGYGYGSEN